MDRDSIERVKKSLLEAYLFRHATKKFDPSRKVSEEDFKFILEAARLSPSSFGMEPWNIIVVQDQALRESIKGVAWGLRRQLPSASHLLLLVVRKAKAILPDSAHVEHILWDIKALPKDIGEELRERYRAFLRDDFHVSSDDQFREWGARQAYIAMGNMMTAAAMIGVDSCPIEGFSRDKAEALLADKGLIDPAEFSLAAMMVFGYREAEGRAKARRPIEEIVRWA